jgi:hypothetical protein
MAGSRLGFEAATNIELHQVLGSITCGYGATPRVLTGTGVQVSGTACRGAAA